MKSKQFGNKAFDRSIDFTATSSNYVDMGSMWAVTYDPAVMCVTDAQHGRLEHKEEPGDKDGGCLMSVSMWWWTYTYILISELV